MQKDSQPIKKLIANEIVAVGVFLFNLHFVDRSASSRCHSTATFQLQGIKQSA